MTGRAPGRSAVDSNPEMIFVRPATFHDTLALGLLIQEALPLSPSSVLNEGTVPQEAFLTGSEVLEGAMVGTEDLLIAEVEEEVAGLVLLKPKELVRSKHVARLQLVVHPEAPGQEVRVALLRAALERSAERALIKVVMDVAQPDRDGDANFVFDIAGQHGQRCRRRLTVNCTGSAEVNERLVDRDRLNQRRQSFHKCSDML